MISDLFRMLFGDGRNFVRETAEVFTVNREAQAQRDLTHTQAAMAQFASEFAAPKKHWFDGLMDGINRLPRPLLALGTIGLIISAMVDPAWFAARMVGLAAVPEPLWWLLGTIVAFYFGGRYQVKRQQFDAQRQAAVVPLVLESQRQIEAFADEPEIEVGQAEASDDEFHEITGANEAPEQNAALRDFFEK